jgi:hypothetical protein
MEQQEQIAQKSEESLKSLLQLAVVSCGLDPGSDDTLLGNIGALISDGFIGKLHEFHVACSAPSLVLLTLTAFGITLIKDLTSLPAASASQTADEYVVDEPVRRDDCGSRLIGMLQGLENFAAQVENEDEVDDACDDVEIDNEALRSVLRLEPLTHLCWRARLELLQRHFTTGATGTADAEPKAAQAAAICRLLTSAVEIPPSLP